MTENQNKTLGIGRTEGLVRSENQRLHLSIAWKMVSSGVAVDSQRW